MLTVVLLLALIWTLWRWHQARALAAAEHEAASLSWTFADGVLDELKQMRGDAARLDADRKDLLRSLDESERQGRTLKQELTGWQQKHQSLASEAQRGFAQWSAYGEQLQQNLDNAQRLLGETSGTLQQERATAEVKLTELDAENTRIALAKEAVEREAQALDASLSSDNHRLCSDVSSLKSTICSLESRIRCLESELARARDDNKKTR